MLAEHLKKYKLTLDDWHQMIDAGIFADRNLEFIDGEIVAVTPEGAFHSVKVDTTSDRIKKIVGDLAYVRAAHPITLDNWEPEPDIALVKPPYKNYFTQNPTAEDVLLLIEMSDSTLNYDLTIKADRYAANNIQEYWVADIRSQVMHVHSLPQGGKYQKVNQLKTGEIFIQKLPGIKVDLSLLWEN